VLIAAPIFHDCIWIRSDNIVGSLWSFWIHQSWISKVRFDQQCHDPRRWLSRSLRSDSLQSSLSDGFLFSIQSQYTYGFSRSFRDSSYHLGKNCEFHCDLGFGWFSEPSEELTVVSFDLLVSEVAELNRFRHHQDSDRHLRPYFSSVSLIFQDSFSAK